MPQIQNANGQYYKNVTLNNLIDLFDNIATGLNAIQSHSFGDIWEIDVTERNYAVSHLSIENASYINNELQEPRKTWK